VDHEITIVNSQHSTINCHAKGYSEISRAAFHSNSTGSPVGVMSSEDCLHTDTSEHSQPQHSTSHSTGHSHKHTSFPFQQSRWMQKSKICKDQGAEVTDIRRHWQTTMSHTLRRLWIVKLAKAPLLQQKQDHRLLVHSMQWLS